MAPAFPAWLESALEELSRMDRSRRAARRRELEQMLGVSRTTFSRMLEARGLRFRAAREGRAEEAAALLESHYAEVFAVQLSSYKQGAGLLMPAEVAIEVAERNGRIPAGSVSADAYRAWVRGQGGGRKVLDEPTRHIHLASLGPNHVHQADFSLAINWKIRNNRLVYEQWVYKNKLPSEGEPRLWRFIVTDHCSGAFFVWYAASVGENVMLLVEGLWRAWTRKRCRGRDVTDIYPFRGVPRILMIDRGPGARSEVLRNFLAWLDVRLNICEGPRSKGQVEQLHRWWEERFESRFRAEPVESIEQLNDEAVQYAAHICRTLRHTRHGNPRMDHWEWHINRSFETQLRVPNCSFEVAKRYAAAAAQPVRVAGDGTVRYRGKHYRVPDVLLHRKKLLVEYSPWEYPAIAVRADEMGAPKFVLEPLERNEHGFFADAAVIGQEFKSRKEGPAQRLVKAAQAIAGTWPGGRLVTRGYHLEGLEASGIRSREMEISGQAEETAWSRLDACLEVAARIGRGLEPAEKRLLARFGERVTESEIRAVVEEIERGVVAEVIPLRAGQA